MKPTSSSIRLLAAGAGAALSVVVLTGQAPQPGASFAAQAQAGQAIYARSCASCHGAALEGGSNAPDLKSSTFAGNWRLQTTRDLFTTAKTSMPPGAEGSIGDEADLNVVAFVLQSNGFASNDALAADRAVAIATMTASAQTAQAPPPAAPPAGRGAQGAAGGG